MQINFFQKNFTSFDFDVNDRSFFGCLGCCELDFSLSFTFVLFPIVLLVEIYSEPSNSGSISILIGDFFRDVVRFDCAATSDNLT